MPLTGAPQRKAKAKAKGKAAAAPQTPLSDVSLAGKALEDKVALLRKGLRNRLCPDFCSLEPSQVEKCARRSTL